VAADRRGAAVRLFMSEGVRVRAVFVTMMRFMPAWPKLKTHMVKPAALAPVLVEFLKG
jgi:hypothetical protein